PESILLFRTEHHALAFHVGRPLQILVQWPDLEAWANRAKPGYVVMPPGSYAELEKELPSWRSLEKILCNTALSGGGHDKPPVLPRTRPPNDCTDARASQAAADRLRAAQRPAPGPQRGGPPRSRPRRLGRVPRRARTRLRNRARGRRQHRPDRRAG